MKITAKEAAKQARVSQSTIYALLRQGRIPAVRIGSRGRGCWRIEQEALDAFVSACKTEPLALVPLKHIK